jgi:hypothetical protein
VHFCPPVQRNPQSYYQLTGITKPPRFGLDDHTQNPGLYRPRGGQVSARRPAKVYETATWKNASKGYDINVSSGRRRGWGKTPPAAGRESIELWSRRCAQSRIRRLAPCYFVINHPGFTRGRSDGPELQSRSKLGTSPPLS